MANCSSPLRTLGNSLLTLLFLTGITLPALRQLCGPVATESKTEQRLLAKRPTFQRTWQGLTTFPKEYESYFNDHFGFRDSFIFCHHFWKAIVMNTSPVDKVLMGKEGWLYFTVNDQLKDYQGLLPYTDKELAGIGRNLQQRQEMLARLGMQYMLVLAPNKHSIYPEYLPDSLVKVGKQTRVDQLLNFLQTNTRVPLLDLRGPLLAAKTALPAEERLYLKLDTHWNQQGAFVAYQAMMAVVHSFFPEVDPLGTEALTREVKPSVRGDLANMIGMQGILRENAPFLTVTSPRSQRDESHNDFLALFAQRYKEGYRQPFMSQCETGKRTVVVFRDSFFTDIIPFFSETFRHATYIYETYNEGIMAEMLARNLKPDLVIEEIIERDL